MAAEIIPFPKRATRLTCHSCNGTGKLSSDCPRCNGTGRVTDEAGYDYCCPVCADLPCIICDGERTLIA